MGACGPREQPGSPPGLEDRGEDGLSLSPAREVLVSIPRVVDNPWVIVGQNTGAHLKDLKGPWSRLCRRAELENLRIHDLRHSFAAVGAGLGLSLPMILTHPRRVSRLISLGLTGEAGSDAEAAAML